MSIQVKAYIDEMNKVYKEMVQKSLDSYELSETDKAFLEIYERTICSRT